MFRRCVTSSCSAFISDVEREKQNSLLFCFRAEELIQVLYITTCRDRKLIRCSNNALLAEDNLYSFNLNIFMVISNRPINHRRRKKISF